jgi:RNA polymerase sigma-70 factor (ECF subfamily)
MAETSDSGGNVSDQDLLAAARKGNSAALEALIVRYQALVYRFGLKMCGDVEDARDVLQETLLSMARSVNDFRSDSSLSTWLYSIARNFCIRKRRKSVFAPPREESLEALSARQLNTLAAPTPSPEQELAGQELDLALTAAIASLDPAQREVLVLRDVEGLTAPDVGKVLGLSVEAVKSRLHRARLTVREKLAPTLGMAALQEGAAPCRDVLRLFSQYLEGDLAPDICAEMEEHVARCPRCRGACESLKRTLALCRNAPTPDLPESVARSVRDAVRDFLKQQAS